MRVASRCVWLIFRRTIVTLLAFHYSHYARQRDATTVSSTDSFIVALGDDVGSQ
jgi:hypothetical protein